jgi:hypothetical protein
MRSVQAEHDRREAHHTYTVAPREAGKRSAAASEMALTVETRSRLSLQTDGTRSTSVRKEEASCPCDSASPARSRLSQTNCPSCLASSTSAAGKGGGAAKIELPSALECLPCLLTSCSTATTSSPPPPLPLPSAWRRGRAEVEPAWGGRCEGV